MRTCSGWFTEFLTLTVACGLALPALHASGQQVKVTAVIHGNNLKNWESLTHYSSDSVQAIAKTSVSQISLNSVTLEPGRPGELWSFTRFPYVVSYVPVQQSGLEFAEPKAEKSVRTIPSLMPHEFASRDVGWTVQMTSKVDHGLIQLQGTSSYIEPSYQQAVYGENPAPKTLAVKNSRTGQIEQAAVVDMPAVFRRNVIFQKSETPFVLFARPGKEYTVKLQCGSEWVDATITCELL